MNWLYMLLIAQILFEVLPISSSGHCLLLASYFHWPLKSDQIAIYFLYLAHVPTALVTFGYFFSVWSLPFRYISRCWPIVFKIIWYVVLADVVTLLGYGIKKIEFLPKVPLSTGFLITAFLLYSLKWCDRKPVIWNAASACILGAVQAVAFIPGVSRFAITFVAACWLGVTQRRAFQISFLIHWPLIIASSMYSYYVLGSYVYEFLSLQLMGGMLVAGIIAYGLLTINAWLVRHKYMWAWSIYLVMAAYISFLREL